MRFEVCRRGLIEPTRNLGPQRSGVSPFASLFPGHLAVCRRTHACTSIKCLRAIHRLDSANSVCNCAVFFAKPR